MSVRRRTVDGDGLDIHRLLVMVVVVPVMAVAVVVAVRSGASEAARRAACATQAAGELIRAAAEHGNTGGEGVEMLLAC